MTNDGLTEAGRWARAILAAAALIAGAGVLIANGCTNSSSSTSQPEARGPAASPRSSHDITRTAPMAPHHGRPIAEDAGRTLLWAGEDPATGEVEWFDVTDALVDPATFQYGIGRDKIRSIDQPAFGRPGDAALAAAGIGEETDVIGFVHGGVSKAYPIFILDRSEVVNDAFAGVPFAVCW